ncbi:fungal specific transcription factor domain-containing protein [Aspergillus nidulans FGSC A4]|uniref:Zn(II)2Cys6 transcription factor (Eurofung) n=1 Tax=Emericella nidulans (strain FGSC A4 / ATCC 38163 / CBS 112.46 / NRRL 194 / M139) TaxID=227321 RepID=C8V7K9_EMENI|nr:hypothetical protein [Aspergillus nidulans FGSC A4]CBF75584.1 TPA: Putative Zn(II)2Cys6 transcription factor (Eurofung) [Aspergillus nidulans FGSC A4]
MKHWQLRSDMEGLSILPQEKDTFKGPHNVYLHRDRVNTSRSNVTARILATTASPASRYAASFAERCQHMDNLCERLEGLAKTLSNCITMNKINGRQDVPTSPRSSASVTNPIQPARHTMERMAMSQDPVIDIPEISEIQDTSPGFRLGAVSGSSGNMQGHDTQTYPTPVDAVGHMVADSYGRLRRVYLSPRLLDGDLTDIISWRRYIGGATNKLIIEAVQILSPGGSSEPAPSKDNEGNEVSLPFFIQGQVWPELPYLPRPQDLSRPPQYVSDLLVGIYFDQLHYTFPILYKPDFMRRYQLMSAANGARRGTVVGRGFLSVFFAVCACASSLLPRASGSASLPGIEYYQKALLCILHRLGNLKGAALGIPKTTQYVETQVARCTWWSVFTLDWFQNAYMRSLMSTCLGRPMATDEADCCCELPFDISNEDLEHGIPPRPAELKNPSDLPLPSSPMTGFFAFARLCRIAARIHRFYSGDWNALLPTLNGFVRELDEWLQELPNEIRFSANLTQSGPNLTMPLAAHYSEGPATAITPSKPRKFSPKLENPSAECINAARSCIQAAELIRERVAPSHYLAFCVQYLTISGILLLSMADDNNSPTLLPDIRNALRFLGDLEAIWPGASRSRLILDRLLQSPRPQPRAWGVMGTGMSNEGDGENMDRHGQEPDVYGGTGAGGWHPSLPVLDELLWEQFPDSSEVFLGLSNFPN